MSSGHGNKRHQSAEDNEVDMTPMIDCIMLLLIFFMTTSKMSTAGAVPLPEARNGGSIDPGKSIVISLFEGRGGKETEIVLGDGKADPGNRPLARNEEEIKQYIKSGLATLKTQVVLKGEERVPNKDMHRVARVVGNFESMELFLAIKDKEEAK